MLDKERFEAIVQKTSSFFDKYNLRDYKEFAMDIAERLLTTKYKDKFARVDEDILAAAIVYVLASVNGVLNYSAKKFSLDDISSFFNQTKKRLNYYGDKIKRTLNINKDERYISRFYTNDVHRKMKFFADIVMGKPKPEIYFWDEAAKEGIFYKYPGRSIVIEIEMLELEIYRKLQLEADRIADEVLDLIGHLLFFIEGGVFTSVTIDGKFYSFSDLNSDLDFEEITIFELFQKAKENTITVEYEERDKVILKLKKILHHNTIVPRVINTRGPILVDPELYLKENLKVLSTKNRLINYFSNNFLKVKEEYEEKIWIDLNNPTKSFLNKIVDKYYLSLLLLP